MQKFRIKSICREHTLFTRLKKEALCGTIYRFMQYKIPQNVQVEDKIVGPLTLKQLIILGSGGGFSYALYTILAKAYYWQVWAIPVFLPAILTILIAFGKIGGIPFGKWCFLSIEYFVNPKKRTFIMGGADNYSATLFAEKPKAVQTNTDVADKLVRDRERLSKIGEISKVLDSYGKPQAI
jgi:hypothetical protein